MAQNMFEQLANVVTDISRAIQAQKRGDSDYATRAFDRALELLDLTISDQKNKGPALKELLRTREVVIAYFLYDNVYQTSGEIWHDYFLNFNYAASLARGK